MVKRWIIMILLTAGLIVGCIFEEKFINNSLHYLINNLETLQIEITENKEKIDEEEFIGKAYSIHENWHEKEKWLKCVMWHTGMKEVETGLARIAVYIEENDYTEAYAEIATLIDYCGHYSEDFRVSIENIL